MRIFLWIVALSMVLTPASALAEIYKYRDANGVVRYTDNIVEVPKSQQKNIKSYQEIKVPKAADEVGAIQSMDDIAKQLQAEKEILDKEFKQLESERLQLDVDAKIARPPSENELFEKKIDDYNLRLQQYEDKRQALTEKVNAYNEAIGAQFK